MAPRANWKGYLRLSLVSCPIALYPGVICGVFLGRAGIGHGDVPVEGTGLSVFHGRDRDFLYGLASRLLPHGNEGFLG